MAIGLKNLSKNSTADLPKIAAAVAATAVVPANATSLFVGIGTEPRKGPASLQKLVSLPGWSVEWSQIPP